MTQGFLCSCCEQRHPEPPMAFHAEAPAYWAPELADLPRSELASDQCVINGEHFFVRGLLEIPVEGLAQPFVWGVWVSLSEESFRRVTDRWHSPGRENDDPYFGWLSTTLDYEPPTLNLKTMLHSRPVGERPWIELEPTDHPLALEQHHGISQTRLQQIIETALHPPT